MSILPTTLDTGEYIIDEPYRQNGNGYDQLEGDYAVYYAVYYKVATKFSHKARFEDREDLLHTIILNLAVAGRKNGHKPDNPSWMYRIASFTVAQYWRDYYQTHGIDCGRCSNPQRKRCKEQNLYSECPRAIKVEYLSKPIIDSEGRSLTRIRRRAQGSYCVKLNCYRRPPYCVIITVTQTGGEHGQPP